MLYSGRDLGVAERIGLPSLISEDLAFERWDAMVKDAKHLDGIGMRLEVNLGSVHRNLRQETDYNTAWNMRTLIMMARAGLLELDASEPHFTPREATEDDSAYERRAEAYWSDYYQRCIVNLREPGHRAREVFVKRIHPSGANAERIAYFLGRKSRDQLSVKTNPDKIDAARTALLRQIAGLDA